LPDAEAIDAVKAFPFLDLQVVLKQELPIFIYSKQLIWILQLILSSNGIMVCHAGQQLPVEYYLCDPHQQL